MTSFKCTQHYARIALLGDSDKHAVYRNTFTASYVINLEGGGIKLNVSVSAGCRSLENAGGVVVTTPAYHTRVRSPLPVSRSRTSMQSRTSKVSSSCQKVSGSCQRLAVHGEG